MQALRHKHRLHTRLHATTRCTITDKGARSLQEGPSSFYCNLILNRHIRILGVCEPLLGHAEQLSSHLVLSAKASTTTLPETATSCHTSWVTLVRIVCLIVADTYESITSLTSLAGMRKEGEYG